MGVRLSVPGGHARVVEHGGLQSRGVGKCLAINNKPKSHEPTIRQTLLSSPKGDGSTDLFPKVENYSESSDLVPRLRVPRNTGIPVYPMSYNARDNPIPAPLPPKDGVMVIPPFALFEQEANGRVCWLGSFEGEETAEARARELMQSSSDEFFVFNQKAGSRRWVKRQKHENPTKIIIAANATVPPSNKKETGKHARDHALRALCPRSLMKLDGSSTREERWVRFSSVSGRFPH